MIPTIQRVGKCLDVLPIVKAERGYFGLRDAYDGPDGIQIAGDTGKRSVVSIPGEACDRCGARLPSFLALGEIRATRIDLAVDISGPSFVVALRDSVRAGQTRGTWQERSVQYFEDDRPGGGCTVQLGARSSMCHACIYDRRGPTRVELRFRHESADFIRLMLVQKGVAQTAREGLAYFFSTSDLEPLQRLIVGQQPITLPKRERKDSLGHAVAWFRRQHGTMLRLLVEEMGLSVQILMRKEDLTSKQLLMLEQWRRELGRGIFSESV